MGNRIVKEVEIFVTPQATHILNKTKYTEEEFITWCLHSRKISFGGADVMIFLEQQK